MASLNEKIDSYYLEKDYNCAESTLRIMNDEYGLGLDEDALKLVGGFGAGMGCGSSCGVLCAGIAALSRVLIKERSHEDPANKETCGAFTQAFEKEMGSCMCAKLKEKYFREDGTRCYQTVEKGAALLEAFLEENCGLKKV